MNTIVVMKTRSLPSTRPYSDESRAVAQTVQICDYQAWLLLLKTGGSATILQYNLEADDKKVMRLQVPMTMIHEAVKVCYVVIMWFKAMS